MTDTTNLGLPLIDAAQAQKHVTHNEALRRLDELVHLSVAQRNALAPPASPASAGTSRRRRRTGSRCWRRWWRGRDRAPQGRSPSSRAQRSDLPCLVSSGLMECRSVARPGARLKAGPLGHRLWRRGQAAALTRAPGRAVGRRSSNGSECGPQPPRLSAAGRSRGAKAVCVRAMALRVTRSLRATAMSATLCGLPPPRRRS